MPFYAFIEKGLEGAPIEEQQMAYAYGAMLMLDYLSLGTLGLATGPLMAIKPGLGAVGTRSGGTALRATEAAGVVKGGRGWVNRFPGVQVRRVGDYWVKRANPRSPALMQKWGRMTISQQATGLERLRAAGSPAANSRLFPSGRLVVEDVGKPLGYGSYFKPGYWSARLRDSKVLGSVITDLRPGNYGAGYRAFDPVIDPIQKSMAIGGATGVTWGTYKLLKED